MRGIGRKWRLGALCTLLVGATVVPVVVLNTVASATSSPTQIVYVQKSGQQTTGPFIEYKGGGGNTSTQSLSLTTGTCSTSVSTVSNPAPAPLLPIGASYYPSGYGSSAKPASVGSALVGYGSKALAQTGVCYSPTTSPGYTVQPSEGLVFAMGENNILTEGQLFSEASIPLKNNNRSAVKVDLVLRKANSSGVEQPVETVGPITVPAAGTESENDTNDCPVVSTGALSSGDEFDQVELQVASPTGSVSVVGPNCDSDNDADDQGLPTFTVANAAAVFTSAASDAVPAGASGSFSFPVSATGTPTPTFSLSGAPSGVSLANTATATGTATLSGTGVAPGVHTFTIDATNSVGTTAQSFTLTVLTTIAQSLASQSGTTTTAGSGTFSASIVTTGQIGTESFSQTGSSTPPGLSVSAAGVVSSGGATLTAGSYSAQGTDSDSDGDSGTWTYTLTVNSVPITQSSGSKTGSTTTAGSAGFTSQIVTGGQVGATESFVPSGASTPPGLTVSPSGAVATSGTLAAGMYVATGSDSDGYGDTGGWSYTLTVGSTSITQVPSSETGTITTAASAGLNASIVTSGQVGATETFVQSGASAPPGLSVSSSGAVSTGGATLAAGEYSVGGSDSDGFGDSGMWTYTLTVSAVPITQTSTSETGMTTTAESAGFNASIVTNGQVGGTEDFSQTGASTPPGLTVSSSGAVSTGGATLAGGVYSVGGTDSDGYGDSGSWGYTLTVDEPPAIISAPNLIVPAPASGGTGTPFSFNVTTTGYPTPALNDSTAFAGCAAALPPSDMGFMFTDNGNGTATMSGTPTSADGGTYTVCIDASNGVAPDATQAFTLVVTSPAVPYAATVSAPPSDPVSANIALNSGTKSFQGFDASQSALGSSTTVTFSTVGTSAFTATVNIDFGDLTYCLPYAVAGTPVCQPTQVTIGPPQSTPTDVLPCSATNMPSPASPATYGWCSEGDSYSYPIVGGVQYTSISQVLFGAGDVEFSHG